MAIREAIVDSPCDEPLSPQAAILPDTNVLTTRFLAPDGIAEITDFMPLGSDLEQSVVVRRVAVTRGRVALRFECIPAFDYAAGEQEPVATADRVLFCGKSSEALFVQSESR